MNASYFWHDYETFGTDPQRDRACQFAGIRTDLDFNVIGDPLMLYCKTPDDYLPHPEACLITGITPQLANEKGVCEAEFIAGINRELALAGTCGLGYNSLRFDDEVTRNMLYRNFFDPYAREWQNGNSRWDLIDVARAARALRPDGIEWPTNEEGNPSFRLEQITAANEIHHQAAHDALSDVYATIGLARLLRQHQPKLYDYLFANKGKQAALQLLQVGSFTPLVHISGRFSAKNNCLAVVLPLCMHPVNSNEVVVYDLSIDPTPLLALSADEIKQRLFVANENLPADTARIPLKTVHINKSPVLAPLPVIRPPDAERLTLDLGLIQCHLQQLQQAFSTELQQKLAQVFKREYSDTPTDPDLMIYSGGFFSAKDKAAMQTIRKTPPQQLGQLAPDFDDARLPEMLFRYRARNYPDTLTVEERSFWLEQCRERLLNCADYGSLDWFESQLSSLDARLGTDQPLVEQLRQYAADKRNCLK